MHLDCHQGLPGPTGAFATKPAAVSMQQQQQSSWRLKCIPCLGLLCMEVML